MVFTPPVIETERLILRMAEMGDAAEIVRYFAENREHLAGSRPRMTGEFFTEDFWRSQSHAALSEFRTDRSLRLFMFERPGGRRVIGNVNFVQFQRGAHVVDDASHGLLRDAELAGQRRQACRPVAERAQHRAER